MAVSSSRTHRFRSGPHLVEGLAEVQAVREVQAVAGAAETEELVGLEGTAAPPTLLKQLLSVAQSRL